MRPAMSSRIVEMRRRLAPVRSFGKTAAPIRIAAMLAFALLSASGVAAAQPPSDAWQTSCPAASAPCIAHAQNGGETRIGVAAVRLSVGERSPSQPVVVVDIGTPVVQARGFGLGVDDQRPLVATFTQCDQIACRAVITGAAAEALVKQFRAGQEAVLVYFATDSQPVKIHVTLKGFTAAYRKVSSARK